MKTRFVYLLLCVVWHQVVALSPNDLPEKRKSSLRGTRGTYAFPPKLANGQIDNQRLIRELNDIHANTYHWLAWGKSSDLDALRRFLPLAKKAGINVWVTLVPHSESPPFQPDYSEPYRLDFAKWATELARLSLTEKNLVAWSIDDFVHNLDKLTPAYVGDFLRASKAINPALAFIPCSYFSQITPDFVRQYGSLLDGILFPYRNESVSADLVDATHIKQEISTLRTMFRPGFPIFLDIYATAHSSLGDSSPQYVEKAIAAGKAYADGVFIYCHQDPTKYADKYRVIKEGFSKK